MARFDALIFDMDGVLVDSEPIHFEATQRMLAEEGVEIEWAEYEQYIGTTLEETWQGFMDTYHLKGPFEDYIRRYDEAVLGLLNRDLSSEAGVAEVLADARATNKALALASSSKSSWVTATLQGLGLSETFEVIVSGDMVTRGKPSPDIYLEAARRLNMQPQRCIAVEDAPKGVVAAKEAGMYTVALRKPYNTDTELTRADTILNTLEEFDRALLD